MNHNSYMLQLGRRAKPTVRETVVPDPDYRIPIVLLGVHTILLTKV